MMQLVHSCTASKWKSWGFEPRKDGTKAQVISTTWKLLKDASVWHLYLKKKKKKPPENESKEQLDLKSYMNQ